MIDPATPDLLVDMTIDDVVPVAAATAVVEQAALGLGIAAGDAHRMAAVVRELVSEARTRETFSGTRDPIAVTARRTGSDLTVQVRDRRMPAVGETYSGLISFRLAQLGFVRDLRFSLGDGNLAECVVGVPSHPSWLDTEQVVASDAAPADEQTVSAITYRRAGVEDAVALTRLTYRCYEYTYVDARFYSPEVLARSLVDGDLRSWVAVAPDGEVVGHQALAADPNGLVPEFSKLMVDPRFRRHGLADVLAARLLAEARDEGLAGAWAECVANHAASQRTVAAAGGTEVGLLLGASPQAVAMAGFEVADEGRRSLVSMYLPLAAQGDRVAYLPERLIAIYRRVVSAMGLQREVTDSDVRPSGTSRLQVSTNAQIGRARVSLDNLAPDALQRIAGEVAGMDTSQLAVLYLDIPLADPSAARAIRIAEERGFFWAALLPDARQDGDVLRLQRLASVAIDTSHIQTVSEHGQAMVDFVLAERERAEAVLSARAGD
ncbi:MAG: GNAT family N-acetyltransferase [Actinobacteria bacterium]|nr:GNAT family N-acetyltransferase [Actinomycetota bacterium]